MNSGFILGDYFEHCQTRVNAVLEAQLTARPPVSTRLLEAMRYATLNAGKRIRPVLAYASAEAMEAERRGGEATGTGPEHTGRETLKNSRMHEAQLSVPHGADIAACAVELIHCYSLIHDDLPAMDDDDLRRGKPTLHRAFDEASAILAGDALQSLAFQLISDSALLPDDSTNRLMMISILARAAGADGMVGGQAVDFEAMGRALSLEELQRMHRLKTGALISASVQLGALSKGPAADDSALQNLRSYGECIGLAFQVQDDILDVAGDTATLGKTQGADERLNKPTYTALLGLEGARNHALELTEQAIDELKDFGSRAEPLRQIARYIVERRH